MRFITNTRCEFNSVHTNNRAKRSKLWLNAVDRSSRLAQWSRESVNRRNLAAQCINRGAVSCLGKKLRL